MSDWKDDLLSRAAQIPEPAHGGAQWFRQAPEYGNVDWPAIAERNRQSAERWRETARYEHRIGRVWYRRYRSMCDCSVLLSIALVLAMGLALWGWLK